MLLSACACKDKNKDCKAWAADGECCKNPDYMLENCPESCSQCGEINEVPGQLVDSKFNIVAFL